MVEMEVDKRERRVMVEVKEERKEGEGRYWKN